MAEQATDNRIGIDLGGTKTEVVVLDADGNCLHRRRADTPSHSYRGILDLIASLAQEAARIAGRGAPVGIGTPGSPSPTTGLMRNSNTTSLNGKPLLRDLAKALGREVRLANDANCFALSEAVDGAGRDGRVVFGAILGTGTGGGIVVDRKLLVGANAVAGEWGHNPLPWPVGDERPGPPCYCGKRGCIETFLSGPGLARDHHGTGGPRLDAAEITKDAAAGDARAQASLERYAERLARALSVVVNLLDPDVIVLGGGLSNIDYLYEAVPQYWSDHVFSDRVATRLSKAQHGDSSGVRGAAWLWPQESGDGP